MDRIYWWTSRVRRDSRVWTTWPVLLIRRGDFAYVQGLVGKYKGSRFSVVNSELTTYPNGKLAVGVKRYLAEYHAQAEARSHGGHYSPGSRTRNDPSKKDRPSGTFRRSIRKSHIRASLKRYTLAQLHALLKRMEGDQEDYSSRDLEAVLDEIHERSQRDPFKTASKRFEVRQLKNTRE